MKKSDETFRVSIPGPLWGRNLEPAILGKLSKKLESLERIMGDSID
ncbi:MAG: hypothetical protein QW542_03430 [Thermoproteota archaeon]